MGGWREAWVFCLNILGMALAVCLGILVAALLLGRSRAGPWIFACSVVWAGHFQANANPYQSVVEEVKVELCQESGESRLAVSRRLLLEAWEGQHLVARPFGGTGQWQRLTTIRLRVEPGLEVSP